METQVQLPWLPADHRLGLQGHNPAQAQPRCCTSHLLKPKRETLYSQLKHKITQGSLLWLLQGFSCSLFGAFLTRIPSPCSSTAPGDGFGAVVPHCEQNNQVQRRHLAKINAETELEVFIFQLQAIHPVTLLCSTESPSVYTR